MIRLEYAGEQWEVRSAKRGQNRRALWDTAETLVLLFMKFLHTSEGSYHNKLFIQNILTPMQIKENKLFQKSHLQTEVLMKK